MRSVNRSGRLGLLSLLSLLALPSLGALAASTSSCAGAGQFGLSSDDNDPAALARAFALEQAPAKGKPMNESGKPLAFVVTATQPKQLMAVDLGSGKPRWTVDANVSSRVVVGGRFVAAREGDAVVARAQSDGAVLWKRPLGAKETFLGAAADGERVFVVSQDDAGATRAWFLIALGSSGEELWRAESPGTLGAPAARGGLVFMPFMSQWLAILDAKTGKEVARVRQSDEKLSFVRTTSDGVFYGSKGVFRLDDKSIAGTRQGATYATAKLPEGFVRALYHFNGFDPIQAGYSAFDRNRVLWRADGDTGLSFKDGLVVVFTFRFFFAFDAGSGELKWAHSHPRNDIVSAEHVGDAVVYLSMDGELGALDPRTGQRLWQVKLGTRAAGATFDADGFRPSGDGAQAPKTVAALAAMVGDKDSRFGAVKLFAITALGGVSGAEASLALLKVILDEATPAPVYQKAAEVLVARKDAEAVPALVKALEVKYDFIAGTRPRAVEVVARTMGAIGRPEGAMALVAHLEDPATPLGTVKEIAEALGKCGNKDALPALRSYLLTYRADPLFGGDSGPLNAVVNALLVLGGGAERELVAFVEADERTQAPVAEYARYALSQKRGGAGAGSKDAGGKDKEPQGAK